jgi:hypothetical protein
MAATCSLNLRACVDKKTIRNPESERHCARGVPSDGGMAYLGVRNSEREQVDVDGIHKRYD